MTEDKQPHLPNGAWSETIVAFRPPHDGHSVGRDDLGRAAPGVLFISPWHLSSRIGNLLDRSGIPPVPGDPVTNQRHRISAAHIPTPIQVQVMLAPGPGHENQMRTK